MTVTGSLSAERAQLGCPPEHVYGTARVACSSQNMVVGFQEGTSAE